MPTSNAAARGFLPRTIAWALVRTPVRALLRYSEHRGAMLADSVTYRALFSIFAGVLLGFSVAALWLSGNTPAWRALVSAVDTAIPGLVGEGGIIDPSSIAMPLAFSVTGIISLVGLLGAAIGAVGSLRAALRTLADRVHDDVPWYWVLLRNLALAIGIGVALAAAAAVTFFATSGIDLVTRWLGIDEASGLAELGAWAVSVIVVLVLDTVVVAVAFRMLSGVKAPARALWTGALMGGIGLVILQQLSGLFVGGATSNPLLATFASLIALLLWINLSCQVILIAASYIVTRVDEVQDRVRARHGADTLAQRRVRVAEQAVAAATEELIAARDAEARERQPRVG